MESAPHARVAQTKTATQAKIAETKSQVQDSFDRQVMAYAMATVFGTDTVVLFTGTTDYENYTAIRETWTYDVSDNQWTRRNHSVAPPSRLGAGMAAVWNEDKVVLFGGYNRSAGHLSDTWIYDLSDNQWYQRGPPEEPSARWFTALATIYDDDKVLLFGGTTNDTQVYDLSDNLWTDLGPVPDPDIHEGSSLATVARTSKTVLFGGYFTFLYQTTWVIEQCAYMRSGEYRSPPVLIAVRMG